MLKTIVATGSRAYAPARCRAYLDLCLRCEETQVRVLLESIRPVDVESVEDFRRRVPVTVAGDSELTDEFVRRQRQSWRYYVAHHLRSNPGIVRGKFLPLHSPSEVFAEHAARSMGGARAAPAAAHLIDDPVGRTYALARFALCENVTFLSSPDPAAVLEFSCVVDAQKETFIREIHDRTIRNSATLSHASRKQLAELARRGRGPRDAAALEAIVARTGTLLPKDYWPNLASLAIPKGGAAAEALPALPEALGDVEVRELGLHPAAGCVLIPFDSDGSHGCLAVTNNFYEFLPEESQGADASETLLAHEVEPGRSYRLVISTSSGLRRHDSGDTIKVVGKHGDAPILRILS